MLFLCSRTRQAAAANSFIYGLHSLSAGCQSCQTCYCNDDDDNCSGCCKCSGCNCVDDNTKCSGCCECSDCNCVDDETECSGCCKCSGCSCVDDDSKCGTDECCDGCTCVSKCTEDGQCDYGELPSGPYAQCLNSDPTSGGRCAPGVEGTLCNHRVTIALNDARCAECEPNCDKERICACIEIVPCYCREHCFITVCNCSCDLEWDEASTDGDHYECAD